MAAQLNITALIRKLEHGALLSSEEKRALENACGSVRQLPPRTNLVSEGDPAPKVNVILEGFACRYRLQSDGRRQVVGLLLPGDMCDIRVCILKQMDHSIGAITRLRVAMITPEEMDELTSSFPRVTQALLWHELVTSATQREWLLNIGQRTAYQRLAHLFVELYLRLRSVGMTQHNSCDFPLTQNDLADATGLTPVHVNRMLQDLRHDGLIELERKHLRIPDIERLKDVAMFNPNYLHLGHEGAYLDSNE